MDMINNNITYGTTSHANVHDFIYEENGRTIYCKWNDDDSYEEWYMLDENRNVIYKTDGDGYEEWREYEYNHCIHSISMMNKEKHSECEFWYKYDEIKKVTYFQSKMISFDDDFNMIQCWNCGIYDLEFISNYNNNEFYEYL